MGDSERSKRMADTIPNAACRLYIQFHVHIYARDVGHAYRYFVRGSLSSGTCMPLECVNCVNNSTHLLLAPKSGQHICASCTPSSISLILLFDALPRRQPCRWISTSLYLIARPMWFGSNHFFFLHLTSLASSSSDFNPALLQSNPQHTDTQTHMCWLTQLLVSISHCDSI